MTNGILAPLASRLLSPLVDATVLLSFDRTGYHIHAAGFRQEDLEVDLTGRICLVTGANAGLGKVVAQGLAERGARTWLLCRDERRGEAAAEQIRLATGNADVHLGLLDVSDLASVRRFAERFPEERVHVLVHNAGVLLPERLETADGIELTFATHVVGPFLLTHLLTARLEKGVPARVIHVSSGGMYTRGLRVDDLQWTKRAFDRVAAYAEAKRAQVVLTELWSDRLADRGITVNAMHPGWADTPGVERSLPGFHRVMQRLLRTPEQGADTVLWLACAPGVADRSGLFWFDREPRRTRWLPGTGSDEAERHALWAACERLAGISAG